MLFVTQSRRFFALPAAVLACAAGAVAAPPPVPPLRWVFQTRHDAQTNPQTDVFLRVGTRQVLVLPHASDEFTVANRTQYKDSGIPADALTACTGWWAGAGDNLYVARRGRSLVVCRKELDEQSGPFPWKRLKIIPLR